MTRSTLLPVSGRRQRGLTLIELMVAITISLFIMAALGSLLVSNTNTRTELDRSSRQIENGRYAVQLLTQEIEQAGYFNYLSAKSYAAVAPTACATGVSALGYSSTTTSGASSTLPFPVYDPGTIPGSTCLPNASTTTPVLIVSRVSSVELAAASAVTGETYLQTSLCSSETQPFIAATTASGGTPYTLTTKDCSTKAPVHKVMQRIYYLATCNDCGTTTNDHVPTLKVAEFVNGAYTVTPLVDGIQDLQFDYGIDMDSNGSPDCYVHAPGAPDVTQITSTRCPLPTAGYDWLTTPANNWKNVVTVRVHVLARSTETSPGWTDTRTYQMGLPATGTTLVTDGPYRDAYKRHVYTATARLYNIAGQRE